MSVKTNYHTRTDRMFGPSAYYICSKISVRSGSTLKLRFLAS